MNFITTIQFTGKEREHFHTFTDLELANESAYTLDGITEIEDVTIFVQED